MLKNVFKRMGRGKIFFQTKRLEKLQTHETTWCIWELKIDHQIWKINCETETSGKLYPFFSGGRKPPWNSLSARIKSGWWKLPKLSLQIQGSIQKKYSMCCAYMTLCDPMDHSPPGSPVHGIFQARIPEQVVISYSRISSWTRDGNCVFCVACIGR